jgi:tetratricopeptide (TPR) repeat protein
MLLAVLLLGAAPEPARADALAEARALAAQGHAVAALRRLDQAMAADPRDVQLRFMRGVLLMDLQRDAEALAHFQQMNLEFPELPDPLNNIALLQARAQRLDDARMALEAALRNDPAHRAALANLGQVYLMLAARTLQTLAAQGPIELQQQRQLDAVRALLLQAARAHEPG